MPTPDARNPHVQDVLPKPVALDVSAKLAETLSTVLGRPVQSAWLEDGIFHVLCETDAASLVDVRLLVKFVPRHEGVCC